MAKFIRSLCTNRPTAAGRAAYTNCAGTILTLWPREAPQLLFSDEPGAEKPFSYLFINLILVDIRATVPSLLAKLNDPESPQTSRRLASALDVLAAFIGHLLAWMEELDASDEELPAAEKTTTFNMAPDLTIKLGRSIGETISVLLEYLRDRWDAAVAGAPGLHPEARTGAAHTSLGSRKTLAWDAGGESGDVAADPSTLSAVRAAALWLRDDDGDALRREAAGLMDMFLELYRQSSSSAPAPSGAAAAAARYDYRLPVLAALEGVLRIPDGIDAFAAHDGWQTLSADLVSIQTSTSTSVLTPDSELLRGTRIALALSIVAESEFETGASTTPESWMGLVTAVAAYDVPETSKRGGEADGEKAALALPLLEFQTDVLRLAASLLRAASPGMRRRYAHTADAVRGVGAQLRRGAAAAGNALAAAELDDVLAMLS